MGDVVQFGRGGDSDNPGDSAERADVARLREHIRDLPDDEADAVRAVEDELAGVAPSLGPDERRDLETELERRVAALRRRREADDARDTTSMTRRPLGQLRRLRRRIGMIGRSPEGDEFGFDPVYAELWFPVLEFLFDRWLRIELHGTEHLPPPGAALFVCNHAGAYPLDALLVGHAIGHRVFPPRPCRALAEDMFFTAPGLGPVMARLGMARADRRNAIRLLRRGLSVVAFPEGLKGMGKHRGNRYRLQRFGRGGAIRVALETGVPLVPVAIVGHEESFPTIARVDAVGRIFGWPFAPITANLALLGPLGMAPLPTRWHIHFGEPLVLDADAGAAEDDLRVSRLNHQLRTTLQGMIDRALDQRRSIWR
jgi:1-acyl-sn-glycerol-3-phosphate acyltransferase